MLNKVYKHCTFLIGCYPCLYCLAHHQHLVTPLSVRGPAPPRTFETISADHQHYIASGVGKKQAQHFYNCISEPIFNIPISQVSKNEFAKNTWSNHTQHMVQSHTTHDPLTHIHMVQSHTTYGPLKHNTLSDHAQLIHGPITHNTSSNHTQHMIQTHTTHDPNTHNT